MARNATEIAAPPETVWSVFADAQAYGEWVVGTKAIVRADGDWPDVGSSIDYELGVGPLTVGDHTVVVEADAPRLLVLRAELGRLGAATIRLELERIDGYTRVAMHEVPIEGITFRLHTRVSDYVLRRRNDQSLRRLKGLAESRR